MSSSFRRIAGRSWALHVVGALMSVCASAEQALQSVDHVTVATPAKSVQDFALLNQYGRDVKFSSLWGQPILVFFGYTHCPDICPSTLLKLQQVKQSAPDEFADLKVVMISVDGDRDTPQVLNEYLARFSPDFIGLTGLPHTVREIGARFPAVFVKGVATPPGESYSVEHSSLVYAFDRQGQLRVQFDDANVEAMAAAIRALLN